MIIEAELTAMLDEQTEDELNKFEDCIEEVYSNISDTRVRLEKIDYMYELLWSIVIPRQELAYKKGLKEGARI